MNPQAAQNYLRTRVMTATPEQLQMMLYDGAIRFAEQARVALQERNFEKSYNSISRVQKILVENYNEPAEDISKVDCPADEEVKQGNTFECKVTIRDEEQTVKITVVNDDGSSGRSAGSTSRATTGGTWRVTVGDGAVEPIGEPARRSDRGDLAHRKHGAEPGRQGHRQGVPAPHRSQGWTRDFGGALHGRHAGDRGEAGDRAVGRRESRPRRHAGRGDH